MTPDLVGQTIDKYRIDGLLGSGGMGQVYRGVHVLLNRPAAIKVMHPALAVDPGFRARFLQEAKAAAALNHPHIVQTYDFGEEAGRFYLVQELMTGGSVRTLLQQAGAGQPLPLPLGLELVRQAAEGLGYAHTQGMVHRDIKPDNLLLDRTDLAGQAGYVVKVSDFGLARLAEGGLRTATGFTMGTPAYMSPEQCQGLELDGRADLYSLGVVLYEVATGYPPFAIKSLTDAVHKHVYVAPPPPREIRSDVPANVEEIILRCLAKRPEERYAALAELAAALRGVLAALGAPAPVEAPPLPGPPPGTLAWSLPRSDAGSSGLTRVTAPGEPVAGSVPPLPSVAGAPARTPRIHVLDRGGQLVRSVDLTGAGLTVGRLPDNDVVLADEAVSRRHLRLDWDGAGVSVTDLGASNGTLLGDGRLLPQVAQPWNPRDGLRVGAYWLRLEPPAPLLTPPLGGAGATAVGLPSAPPVTSGRLRVLLEQETLTLTPGQPAAVRATLANLGSTVDHLTVTVDGVPAGWVQSTPAEVQLNPGAQAPVVLTVNVARASENRAGEYPVRVRARSRENPAESGVAQATWSVLPFEESTLAVIPATASGVLQGKYNVRLENAGNAGQRYAVQAADQDGALRCHLDQDTLVVDPGEAGVTRLNVRRPPRWIGRREQHTIGVSAAAVPDGAPRAASARFTHRALVAPWVPPAVLGVALAAFLVARMLMLPQITEVSTIPVQPVAGQQFIVKWQTRNATTVDILPLKTGLDPGPGGNGNYVFPKDELAASAQLTVVATNRWGRAEKTVQLTMLPPSPTPTVAPTPTAQAQAAATPNSTAGPTPTAALTPTVGTSPTPIPTPVPPTPTSTPMPPTPTPTQSANLPQSGVPLNPLLIRPFVANDQQVAINGSDFAGAFDPLKQTGQQGDVPANSAFLFGGGSQFNTGTATFTAQQTQNQLLFIELRAMDDPNLSKVPLRIKLNGTIIWEGQSPFPNGTTGDQAWLVADHSLLKAGTNTLEIDNLSPNGPTGAPPWELIQQAIVYF